MRIEASALRVPVYGQAERQANPARPLIRALVSLLGLRMGPKVVGFRDGVGYVGLGSYARLRAPLI